MKLEQIELPTTSNLRTIKRLAVKNLLMADRVNPLTEGHW